MPDPTGQRPQILIPSGDINKVTRFPVAVDSLEVAIFPHDGSAYGEPHNHLHVQVGSMVQVSGQWQAIDGPSLVRSVGGWQANVGAARVRRPWWKRTLTNKQNLFR